MSDEAKKLRTVADYIDENTASGVGSPGHMKSRNERMKAIKIDGRPLGEYELDFERNREQSKEFIEYQWVAISLVGCDADLEIVELRKLPTRSGKATPDFEATMNDGRTIRVELCRLLDEDEQKFINALGRIGVAAQERIEDIKDDNLRGEYFVRFYKGADVKPSDVSKATSELVDFVRTEDLREVSITLYLAPEKFPNLRRLECRVAHRTGEGPAHVLIDPPLFQSDADLAMKLFDSNVAEKKAKCADYADEGYPVWLVLVAQSYVRRFIAASLVGELRNIDTFDPSPFEKVLVGCRTMGVTFEAPNQRPKYTSLSTTD